MTRVRAKAPLLAWLLTALTCLLAGMAIVESRHQALALPYPEAHSEDQSDGTRPSIGVAKPVDVDPPTGTPEPTSPPILGPGEPPASSVAPVVEVVPLSLSNGPVILQVVRLTVPPGVGLPFKVAPGPTVLLVESGTLSVRFDGAVFVDLGLDPVQIDAALSSGERLVIAPYERYAVRNDGPTPAEALVVSIVPGAPLPPILGSETRP